MDTLLCSRLPLSRPLLLLAIALAACCATPAVARADDLIQLSGDPPVVLSGNVGYGLLYLDGTVRLAGNTAITATSVFIGPDAQLQTCYDPATDMSDCSTGRGLSITAKGGVSIAPAIDLRGTTGTSRVGGSLMISAGSVALGGGVETAGTNAPSGSILINSPGFVVTQNLHAPGAGIVVHGGAGVQIGGDVWSAGSDTATGPDPTRATSGGAVDLASSNGDVNLLGSISSWGRDVTTAGPVAGGNGGSIAVSAGNVHISGSIDASAGRGTDTSAGAPGAIALKARGALIVSGAVTASGDSSTSGAGSDGAPIAISSKNALTVGSVTSQGGGSTNLAAGAGGAVTLTAGAALTAGGIATTGGSGPQGGRHGGAVSISAPSASLGAVTADAGDATLDAANGSGESGGAVTIRSTGDLAVGSVSARGGSGRGSGGGGVGGVVSISGDHVSTGSITALGEDLSAQGGSVSVTAQSSLIVGGPVDASGANGVNGNPARPGGNGGAITLRIPGGPLTLAGPLRSQGGFGGSGGGTGAPGGSGGSVLLVVGSIEASSGVLTGGGDGGNSGLQNGPSGAGGNGGRVSVWAQVPSLILLQLVDSSAGDGDPNGTDGPQLDESAPTHIAISNSRVLSFTSNAPDADGYRLMASIGKAAPKLVTSMKKSGGTIPKVAPCVKVAYTLVAFDKGVGWQSLPTKPVTYKGQPSGSQGCKDAPQVTLGLQTLEKRVSQLRSKNWRVPVTFLADGFGTARVVLSRGGKTLLEVDKVLGTKRRNVTATLTIPKALRKAGSFLVTVRGVAPEGKARSKSSLVLEVKT